jgi:hypothetical protein
MLMPRLTQISITQAGLVQIIFDSPVAHIGQVFKLGGNVLPLLTPFTRP